MNTALSRLNTIFAFTLSVMAGLTFLCFLSTFFNEHKADVAINTGKVIVKNVPDYSAGREKNDLGFVVFDLQTDLSGIFNWNVKQLFLYLFAEYETEDHKLNQVVIWDKIIKRGENSVLDYKKANTKYYFWDFGNGLRSNKNVTLSLSWNVIPNAGTLPKIQGVGQHKIEFPSEYSPNRFQ
ncbi:signal peptidase complex subunit 3-like [Dreissena polymorpha]|uniref:signal peptidase complex subunit 3-like n=1 Tax=Dreissena polymorpha TaxID=45954 RepID=UPI002264744F|nr:signal peptidase complex subunit 3-like [Dreissena polymorpha]